jgi:hypothetical protein
MRANIAIEVEGDLGNFTYLLDTHGQKIFLIPLTPTLSPRWGRGDKRKKL